MQELKASVPPMIYTDPLFLRTFFNFDLEIEKEIISIPNENRRKQGNTFLIWLCINEELKN